jgi:rubrerythrin
LFAVNEILDIAIRLEKNSRKIYLEAAAKTSVPEIETALEWIAGEESAHVDWFEGLKTEVSHQTDTLAQENLDSSFLNTIIGKEAFSLENVDFADIWQVSELIEVFIESEKDGILFYEMLKAFVLEEEARNLLDRIIAEEDHHIETFRALKTAVPSP